MQNILRPSHRAHPALPAFWPGRAAPVQPDRCQTPAQTDELFVDLLNAYRASGGLARLGEVIARARGACGHEVAPMAAWIFERKVLSFEWQADLWLPLFQFNRADMTPSPATQQVVRTLNPVLGPWALAAWFARPHVLLDNRSPADALGATPGISSPAVMRAARAVPAIAIV